MNIVSVLDIKFASQLSMPLRLREAAHAKKEARVSSTDCSIGTPMQTQTQKRGDAPIPVEISN